MSMSPAGWDRLVIREGKERERKGGREGGREGGSYKHTVTSSTKLDTITLTIQAPVRRHLVANIKVNQEM